MNRAGTPISYILRRNPQKWQEEINALARSGREDFQKIAAELTDDGEVMEELARSGEVVRHPLGKNPNITRRAAAILIESSDEQIGRPAWWNQNVTSKVEDSQLAGAVGVVAARGLSSMYLDLAGKPETVKEIFLKSLPGTLLAEAQLLEKLSPYSVRVRTAQAALLERLAKRDTTGVGSLLCALASTGYDGQIETKNRSKILAWWNDPKRNTPKGSTKGELEGLAQYAQGRILGELVELAIEGAYDWRRLAANPRLCVGVKIWLIRNRELGGGEKPLNASLEALIKTALNNGEISELRMLAGELAELAGGGPAMELLVKNFPREVTSGSNIIAREALGMFPCPPGPAMALGTQEAFAHYHSPPDLVDYLVTNLGAREAAAEIERILEGHYDWDLRNGWN